MIGSGSRGGSKKIGHGRPAHGQLGSAPGIIDDDPEGSLCTNSGAWFAMPETDLAALHEVAHVIIRGELGRDAPSHGWQFCRTYLKLVLWVKGAEAHDALLEAFQKHKVRHGPPGRKRPPTESQRAALVERIRKVTVKKGPVCALA